MLLNPFRFGVAPPPPFDPAVLFLASEKGGKYDAADLATTFQDIAGLTAVSGMEQRVGKWLDTSGNGLHFTAPSDGARPTITARVNDVLGTTTLTGAGWLKSAMDISTGAADPDGGSTALTIKATGGGSYLQFGYGSVTRSSRVWLRKRSGTGFLQYYVSGYITFAGLSSTWQEFTYTGNGYFGFYGMTSGDEVDVWHPDVRAAAFDSCPPYQEVLSATDYDASGFPVRLKFSGAERMSTAACDMTGTDVMTVAAGAQKQATSLQVLMEFGANPGSDVGSMALYTGGGGSTAFSAYSRGTAASTLSSVPGAAVERAVVLAEMKIGGPYIDMYKNGSLTNHNTSSQGTGNYGNHSFFIGARSGGTYALNGEIAALVIRGAATSAPDKAGLAEYLNGKIVAY